MADPTYRVFQFTAPSFIGRTVLGLQLMATQQNTKRSFTVAPEGPPLPGEVPEEA